MCFDPEKGHEAFGDGQKKEEVVRGALVHRVERVLEKLKGGAAGG